MRHCATRITAGDISEAHVSLFISERMQQSDGTIERGRNRCRTTRLQVNRAEMLWPRMIMLLRACGTHGSKKYGHDAEVTSHLHPRSLSPIETEPT